MKALFAAFRPAAGWMLLGMLLSLLSVLANIALLTLSSWFIAATAAAGVSGALFNYLLPSVGVRAFALFRTGGRYLERLVTHDATFRILATLKRFAYEQIAGSYQSGMQPLHSGDAASRLQHDIDTLESFYSRGIVPLFVAVVGVAITVGFLWLYSGVLAVGVGLLLLLVGALLPLVMRKGVDALVRERVSLRSKLRVHTVDYVEGMAELTVSGATGHAEQKLRRSSDRLDELNRRIERSGAISEAITILASGAAVLLAVVAAVPLIQAGVLPATHLALLSICALVSFETVQQLPEAIQHLAAARAAAARVFPNDRSGSQSVQTAPEEPRATKAGGQATPPSVRISGATVHYPGAAEAALKQIALELPPYGKYALVGPVGSGKSSLAGLLAGLVEPREGGVSPEPNELRREMAVLEQHPHIFHARVRDNLLIADPDAEDETLLTACSAAYFRRVVEQLPAGLYSVVGRSGSQLSAGEQKRLGLARTLLKPSSLLVLDEPTEHLDAETERRVLDSIFACAYRKSLLVITHRLVSMERFDHVFVMDRGRIVEHGTHGALLAAGGVYAHMWSML